MLGKKYAIAIADILSQKLGLNVRFYGKSFIFLTLGYTTSLLRGIASTYLVARWVSPEVLGQFRYMIAMYGVAGIFSLSGYGSSMVKGLALGETAPVRYAIRKTLMYAPLGGVLLIVAAIDKFLHGESSVGWAIVVAAISFVPYTLCSFFVSILTGLGKIKELSFANLWSNTVYAVLFFLVLLFSKQLIVLTVAYFLIDILVRGFITWRVFIKLPAQVENENTHKEIGNHLNWILVMTVISASISQILLQRIWGYAALATFSVAMILPEQLLNLAKTMSGVILQRLSKQANTVKNLQAVRRHFWNAFIGSFVLIAAYVAIAPFMMPLFFPKYPDAVLPSIVYVTGLLGIPSLIGVYYFQAHGYIRSMWRFNIASSTIQALTSIALVPLFGQWGAILSRVITRIGSLPFSYPGLSEYKNKEHESS